MNNKLFYFLTCISFVDVTYGTSFNTETFEHLTRPIVCTRIGLESFFIDQFNAPDYTKHILPSHFGHLMHLLHFSKTVSEPFDFTVRIFDIFHTRLKDTRWVNALSVSLLLDQLPEYLEELCTDKQEILLEESVKEILYKRLISRFTKLSNNPLDGINSIDSLLETIDQLVDPTAREIAELVVKTSQKKAASDLQELVTRFIESSLEKIVWNPQTHEDSWESLCLLADQIKNLHECGIIASSKTVNHLYWTLLYRYGYFLESTKDILNPDIFEYIKTAIASRDYEWLSMPEPEDFLTSKKEYLKYTIWECITQREAAVLL